MKNGHNELVKRIAIMLESDINNVDENFLIDSGNLDSLTILTLMAAIDELYEIKITSDQILSSKTIGGLLNLIDGNSN